MSVSSRRNTGSFLGRGSMSDVYETVILGQKLAWKRTIFRSRPKRHYLKEIDILKKLSHTHLITFVASYSHRNTIGLLYQPVAVCDLYTFFDDVEGYWAGVRDDLQLERLEQLGFHGQSQLLNKASPVCSQMGCLLSAVAYLHEQKVRHKDLKPSNVLLLPHKLFLSDLGNATDFSGLSQSATDNERSTPKYHAPEVRFWAHSERPC